MIYVQALTQASVVMTPTHPLWPRGLNQLGNTCYLNSLLQYFYTIKALRDAIVPNMLLDDKYIDYNEVKEDDLKHHRVGGRLVSRHEVVRSRKCKPCFDLLYSQIHSFNFLSCISTRKPVLAPREQ